MKGYSTFSKELDASQSDVVLCHIRTLIREESYPSAEMQLAYSTATADQAITHSFFLLSFHFFFFIAWRGFYPSTEMRLAYSTATTEWAIRQCFFFLDVGFTPLQRCCWRFLPQQPIGLSFNAVLLFKVFLSNTNYHNQEDDCKYLLNSLPFSQCCHLYIHFDFSFSLNLAYSNQYGFSMRYDSFVK